MENHLSSECIAQTAVHGNILKWWRQDDGAEKAKELYGVSLMQVYFDSFT